MQKILIFSPGGYDKLKLVQGESPVPSANQVLISVESSGINYADIAVRWGVYGSAKKFVGWPITPGFELSGRIKAVGSSVTRWRVGDEVVGISLFGAYTSEIALDQQYVFAKPKNWSFAEAAAFPAVFLTAYHGLFQNIVIRPGAKILIHSAAGGVGTALLQMCKLKGFKTVAVVGSSHKIATAREFGADEVIDKSSEDLWAKARAYAPNGYDVVFDANGVETLKQSELRLRECGKLVIYGFHTMMPKQGGRINWPKLIWSYLKTPRYNPLDMIGRNISVITFNISYLWERHDLVGEAMHDILQWIERGQLRAPTVQIFPLKDVAQAHQALESGKTVGKLVLDCQ